MMEMFLSEEKAKLHNIDLQRCYEVVDKYFAENGVEKLDTGVYKGTDKDFSTIMGAQWDLPKTNWFLKVVDQWYFRYEGDSIEYREDALESYYRIKAKSREFFKNKKSY